jgi:hypothetical protein
MGRVCPTVCVFICEVSEYKYRPIIFGVGGIHESRV